jgi:dihydroorotate dehydrogenase
VAGLVIATIGVTNVFVPEDLKFLHTTPTALHAANPHLIPLMAHDRTGFGGALVSDGLAILLTVLWGFRQGARWVWWTLAAAGISEFVAAVVIHLSVGYTNLWHLTPTFLAALPYAIGLTLSHPYLCKAALPRTAQARAIK